MPLVEGELHKISQAIGRIEGGQEAFGKSMGEMKESITGLQAHQFATQVTLSQIQGGLRVAKWFSAGIGAVVGGVVSLFVKKGGF